MTWALAVVIAVLLVAFCRWFAREFKRSFRERVEENRAARMAQSRAATIRPNPPIIPPSRVRNEPSDWRIQ